MAELDVGTPEATMCVHYVHPCVCVCTQTCLYMSVCVHARHVCGCLSVLTGAAPRRTSPSAPASSLQVRKMAPEYYDHLPQHHSWVKVLWDFVFEDSLGPYARVKRVYRLAKDGL